MSNPKLPPLPTAHAVVKGKLGTYCSFDGPRSRRGDAIYTVKEVQDYGQACWAAASENQSAELHRLRAENEALRAELEENESVIRVWRGRTVRAENHATALQNLLIPAVADAEWRDKHIYPVGGEAYQNWLLQVYLPVPLSETDKTVEGALARATGRTA